MQKLQTVNAETLLYELMENLGKIADKYHLPIQSHLSENTNEIAWVQELHTDCTHLWALGQRQPLQP